VSAVPTVEFRELVAPRAARSAEASREQAAPGARGAAEPTEPHAVGADSRQRVAPHTARSADEAMAPGAGAVAVAVETREPVASRAARDAGREPATPRAVAVAAGPPEPEAPHAVPAVGECHVWLVPVRPRPSWEPLLDGAERARAERFAMSPARHTFVTSRGAQRLIGAHYLGIPPEAVTVARGCPHCGAQHGRPRFPGAPVDYSVSHTDDWVALAVVSAGLVGTDLEALGSLRDPDTLANAILTPEEHPLFTAVPRPDRALWLLTAWTRKESAMKLTGLGLQAPPTQLDVSTPRVAPGPIPRWPSVPIHLTPLPAPPHHAASLATTVPLTTIRTYNLPEQAVPAGRRHGS
jgi:4'-phosphopantetheinyl transferase